MADNLELNAGSGGGTLRTDDDGTAHWQYIKLAFGADNTQTIVSDSNPLPIDDAGGSLTVDGTVAATQSGTWNVTNVSGTVSLPTGAATAAKQPALGAAGSASSDVITVQGIASMTALVVDGSGVTQPVSGTITANLSATDNAVLDQIDSNTDYGAVTGGGVEASALRVTIASDSTGVVSIDDNGGSLTVDGTVTANLSATDNAVLDTIAANTGPQTSGGISSVYRDEDIDETAVAAKASAGQVYWIHCINLDATPVYLHFYDVAQGSVTVGTTTELMSFAVPSQGDANGAGFTMSFPHGIEFGTAITIACTTTIGGTAGPGANEVILNVGYA